MTRGRDKKPKMPEQLRGQLMLQIAAGRFFRPGVALNETIHRRTLHTNAWLADKDPVDLPVGRLTGGTERDEVSTAFVEAVDKLEAVRPDGSNDFMIATGGNELVDDIAYVLTFALNATFSRDSDAVRRLVPHEGTTGRRRSGAALFPRLFDPRLVVQPDEMQCAREFMSELLHLGREDFARVMRVIRRTVDATRRAPDDPTGAYTDLVAALESLSDKALSGPTTWERYDPQKRKLLDPVLARLEPTLADEMRTALLDADHAGATRQFVASTLARITPDYYRREATGALSPPRSADVEEMLRIGYSIRSRRSHALEDLGQEAWVFSDGAEVAWAPGFDRVFTLAGLWRLVRHVVNQYVATAPRVADEPWDYRMALPGIITARLAPQLWVGSNLDVSEALERLNGVADALIGWHASGRSVDAGFGLAQVSETIEHVVPGMPDSDAKKALVAIHRLWHEWIDPRCTHPKGSPSLRPTSPCCASLRQLPTPWAPCRTSRPATGRRRSGWTWPPHVMKRGAREMNRRFRPSSTLSSSSRRPIASRLMVGTPTPSPALRTLSKRFPETRCCLPGSDASSPGITIPSSTSTRSCSGSQSPARRQLRTISDALDAVQGPASPRGSVPSPESGAPTPLTSSTRRPRPGSQEPARPDGLRAPASSCSSRTSSMSRPHQVAAPPRRFPPAESAT